MPEHINHVDSSLCYLVVSRGTGLPHSCGCLARLIQRLICKLAKDPWYNPVGKGRGDPVKISWISVRRELIMVDGEMEMTPRGEWEVRSVPKRRIRIQSEDNEILCGTVWYRDRQRQEEADRRWSLATVVGHSPLSGQKGSSPFYKHHS